MAIITGIPARNMRRRFTCRGDAIVTRSAEAQYLSVVYRNHWKPCVRVVTVFANIAGLNMSRVLTGCVGTVVAVDAAVDNIRVVEVRRNPADCRMTVITIFTTCDMCRILSGRRVAIMA